MKSYFVGAGDENEKKAVCAPTRTMIIKLASEQKRIEWSDLQNEPQEFFSC